MEGLADLLERSQQDGRDFDAPEIADSKDEHSGVAGSQRRDLQRTISQPLIPGEHGPVARFGLRMDSSFGG
jgi:hypothetical protein